MNAPGLVLRGTPDGLRAYLLPPGPARQDLLRSAGVIGVIPLDPEDAEGCGERPDIRSLPKGTRDEIQLLLRTRALN
jgi:hypothetical protein